jgi:hypothetical protein
MKNNIFILKYIDSPWLNKIANITCPHTFFVSTENISETNFLKEFLIEITFNNQSSKLSFLQRFLEYIFFDCVFANQSVNMNSFCLSNSVASILSLLVHCWIPVSIIKNNAVCTS